MFEYWKLVDSPSLRSTVRLSAVSGLVWALIACSIGYYAWGGILAAPLIGILIGCMSRWMHNQSRKVQIAGSLINLYIAALCFAAGMALPALALGELNVRFSETLMKHVFTVLWGLTFGGYALILWPLSFFNHRLVWKAGAVRAGQVSEL